MRSLKVQIIKIRLFNPEAQRDRRLNNSLFALPSSHIRRKWSSFLDFFCPPLDLHQMNHTSTESTSSNQIILPTIFDIMPRVPTPLYTRTSPPTRSTCMPKLHLNFVLHWSPPLAQTRLPARMPRRIYRDRGDRRTWLVSVR